MTLTCMSGFMALVPSQPSAELQDLADSCVIEFDEFRPPADEAELARRRAAGPVAAPGRAAVALGLSLCARGVAFPPHLTGRIGDDGERSAITDLLRRQFVGFIDRPLRVRDLCVFVSPPPAGRSPPWRASRSAADAG